MVGGHLDTATRLSGEDNKHSLDGVGTVGDIDHVREGSLALHIRRQNAVADLDLGNGLGLAVLHGDSLRGCGWGGRVLGRMLGREMSGCERVHDKPVDDRRKTYRQSRRYFQRRWFL